MSSSLLLQQYPACLVHLIWMVFVMGGWWPYSCCFMYVSTTNKDTSHKYFIESSFSSKPKISGLLGHQNEYY